MTMISSLHNMSRSIGCALLASMGEGVNESTWSGKAMLIYFVAGEMLVYLMIKIARGDFMYWVRIDGIVAVILAFLDRVIVKVIVDFSGCLHFR